MKRSFLLLTFCLLGSMLHSSDGEPNPNDEMSSVEQLAQEVIKAAKLCDSLCDALNKKQLYYTSDQYRHGKKHDSVKECQISEAFMRARCLLHRKNEEFKNLVGYRLYGANRAEETSAVYRRCTSEDMRGNVNLSSIAKANFLKKDFMDGRACSLRARLRKKYVNVSVDEVELGDLCDDCSRHLRYVHGNLGQKMKLTICGWLGLK